MKRRNVLVIQRGYSLGINTGDKMRTMNMLDSLCVLGYNVVFLGFFTRNVSHFNEEKRKLVDKKFKSLLFFSLPNRYGFSRLAEWLRAIVTYFVCKKYKIDIIQAEVSFSATAARLVPEIPLITDFHADLVPELEMARFSQSAINHARRENTYALKRSLKTITVSQNLYENLQSYLPSTQANNYILPCNFRAESFLQLSTIDRERMRKKYSLDDRIVLCYSGGLHVWQCIEETLDIVIRLHEINPQYFFCLFTNDDPSTYSQQLKKLEGNYLIKSLKGTEVPLFLSMIDVGFVLRENSLVNINSSPTKTSEYMAVGAMVVATQYAGDAPQLISESGHGFVFKAPSAVNANELQLLDEAIRTYCVNYEANAAEVKRFVFEKRVWASNEQQLKTLYQEMEKQL